MVFVNDGFHLPCGYLHEDCGYLKDLRCEREEDEVYGFLGWLGLTRGCDMSDVWDYFDFTKCHYLYKEEF